jgi:hypothetical protein
MEEFNWTLKIVLTDDNLLQQNVNTSSLLLKITTTPGNLHSTYTYKQKLKMSSPLTTAKLAPDM